MRYIRSAVSVFAIGALAAPLASHAQNNSLVVGMPTTPPNVVHMLSLIHI